MSFFKFIKSKTFVKHLILALSIVAVLFFITFKFLNVYTLHGETFPVPDFSGVKTTELDVFIKDTHLRYEIIDSIYETKQPKGIVVSQDPEPGARVKDNRTIYLYVSAMQPPKISMPNLTDRSLRQASSMIETYGLRLGNITYVPDQCVNCVLQQLHKGQKIESGVLIEKNSVITLIVGKGLGDEKVPIPNLIGLTRSEAQQKLSEYALNEGALGFDSKKDSTNARIYKQIPAPSKDSYINMGSSIDLFFTLDQSKINFPPDTTINENEDSPE